MELTIDLLLSSLGAVVFSVLGLFAELQGVESLLSGELVLGLWLSAFGLLLLYAGVYLLGYERVAKQLHAARL